jgi:hypothetical protein
MKWIVTLVALAGVFLLAASEEKAQEQALMGVAAAYANGPSATAASVCGNHTAKGHRWVLNLRGSTAIPRWAKVKHRRAVKCAKGPNHRKVMRTRWGKVKRSLKPANHDLWLAIGRCEQPGAGYGGVNWTHPGPTYQGGLGFYYATWDGWKPAGYPADAGSATWRQQMIVAQRVANDVGYSAWGCYGR